jgi:hypothetical protein
VTRMTEPSITPDIEPTAILARFPACRKRFRSLNGLVGCGGPLGRQESLSFFARAHRVDEARLLAELNETARTSVLQPDPPEYTPESTDVINRRYFRAAIVTMFNLRMRARRHQPNNHGSQRPTRLAGYAAHYAGPCASSGRRVDQFLRNGLRLSIDSAIQVHHFLAAIAGIPEPVRKTTALTVRTLADVWIGIRHGSWPAKLPPRGTAAPIRPWRPAAWQSGHGPKCSR